MKLSPPAASRIGIPIAAAAILMIAGCTSVNRLAEFAVQGQTLAADMRLPPEPDMDVQLNLKLDFSNLFGTAMNVGSNIAKAANANRVDRLMREALQVVDVPAIVRDESYATCLTVLGAQEESDPGSAQYLLGLDIHRYGIHASSWTSEVELRIKLTAILYQNQERVVVWRRDVDVEREATPAMFGLDPTVGNFVTTAALASMSEESLQNGFDQLARDAAQEIARTLQDDLYAARFGY
ncbi:MAG TPA: hypothetical protein VMU36_03410 [Spirochaetia bacterium]|nr:hypothetical protein [Spirochaetia bacterium]